MHGVVQRKEVSPIGLLGGPMANRLQVFGAICERIGSPGEQEYVLNRSQSQQIGRNLRDSEDDDALFRLFDLTAEVARNLIGRDRLQSGVDVGVASRDFAFGSPLS